MLLLFVFLAAVSTIESKFTPTKYQLTLTPEFGEDNGFTGNTKIYVNVTGSVEEYDLKVSKEITVERVAFFQASTIYRGRVDAIGEISEFKVIQKDNKIHVTLPSPVTPESIKQLGYIEVDYKGKAGKKGANKGLYLLNAVDYETNLKNGNAIYLFPILEDVSAPIKLSVITPYRAGVETKLKAGEHRDVTGKELISNNFESGDEKMKVSDLYFKVNAPTALILDSN